MRARPWSRRWPRAATVRVALVCAVMDTPPGTLYSLFVARLPAADPLLACVDRALAAVALAPRLLARVPLLHVRARGARADARAAPRRSPPAALAPRAWARCSIRARSFEANNETSRSARRARPGLPRPLRQSVPSLPLHAAGHPPGRCSTLNAGIDSAGGMVVLRIAARACSVARSAYLLGRQALDERGARELHCCSRRPGRAAVRRHVSRRGVPDAGGRCLAARGAVVAGAPAPGRWSRWIVVVAAGGRRLGGDQDVPARRAAGGAGAVRAARAGVVAFTPCFYAGTCSYRHAALDQDATARGSPRSACTGTGPPWSAGLVSLACPGVPIAWSALRALMRGETPAIATFAVIAFAAVMSTKATASPTFCCCSVPAAARHAPGRVVLLCSPRQARSLPPGTMPG